MKSSLKKARTGATVAVAWSMVVFLLVLPVGSWAQMQSQSELSGDNGRVELPRFPSISPDGSEIVFSWGGDLWRISAAGGQARRLTRHNLDDLHSSWSADGQWITFTSMRDGYMNLWRIHRDGTRLTQLTHTDRFLRHPAYSQNAQGQPIIMFSASVEADVYREDRPYVMSAEGGQYTRLHEAFGSAPDMSPNGQRLAFTRGGYYHDWNRRHYRGPDAMDVWIHDRRDDSFSQITTHSGDDGRAQWADDRSLVFMSDRELDTVNLYRVDIDAGERVFERLTDFQGRDLQHFDLSRDGNTAVLHVWDTLYTLDLRDPDAEPVALELRAVEDGRDDYTLRRIDRDISEAALSPDGKVMAYIAYGRVYIRHMDEHSPTRAVTRNSHARHQNLAWSPDGARLYFSHDGDGTESIYQAQVALTRDEVRQEYRGRTTEELAEPEQSEFTEQPLGSLPEPSAEPAGADEPDGVPQGQGGATPSPEDPFGPVDPGAPFDPLTDPEPNAPPVDPVQEPVADPQTVPEAALEPTATTNQEDLPANVDPKRWHDAVQFTVTPVVKNVHNDREPHPSPDGRYLAFRRGLGNLMIMDLQSKDIRTLVKGWDFNIHWRWSPDSRYIAYSQNDMDYSANIFIVPADGSAEPVNITRHPRNDVNPRWSADGRVLTFISNRSAETYDLYRVYLDRDIENYSARELTTYYRDARSAAGKRQPLPVNTSKRKNAQKSAQEATVDELDLEDAWQRVTRVTAGPTHQYANEMTPGADRYVFNSSGEGLIVMNWDGSDRRRLGPTAYVQHLSLKGDQLVYITNGRVRVASLTGSARQSPDISDRIRINLRQQSLQKFYEAARIVGESFYRSDMKGIDWQQVTEQYAELIQRARTSSEFSDIANRLMGELAASHLGINNPGPGSILREPSGRLGIEYELVTLAEDRIGYRVTHIVPEGPAARGPMRLEPGDLITEVALEPFGRYDTLLQRLRGRVGEEVIITFERRSGRRTTEHRALLTPVDFNELARLKYDAFREESQRRVDELSGGRLGYLHIQAMNQASLDKFQGDLYAAAHGKDGLIIDVRNNGGGNTTDRILTSITAPQHAYTIPAGADHSKVGHYPQDRLDAPRYTLPVNMLANEKSFSNAEILAHAFKILGRGTLVGQQTYGGVISTGSYNLIDGASVRRPFRGWYLPDGTDMEHNGAMPDVLVEQTPEDEVDRRDRQLEAAVENLLKRLDQQGARR